VRERNLPSIFCVAGDIAPTNDASLRAPVRLDCGVFYDLCGTRVAVLSLLISLLLALSGCNHQPALLTGRVSGNSMEPHFAGDRAYFRCGSCELDSHFSPPPSSDEEFYCPRCHADVSISRTEAGELIQYEKVTDSTLLELGDVIVFDPQKARNDSNLKGLQIKRIAALPDQSLRLKSGDLWNDGKRQQTNCNRFLQRAVEIDDAILEAGGINSDSGWMVYWPGSLYPRRGANFERHSSWLLDESPWDIHESRDLVVVTDYGIEFEFANEIDETLPINLELKLRSGDREIGVLVTRSKSGAFELAFDVRQSDQTFHREMELKSLTMKNLFVVVVDGSLQVQIDRAQGAFPIPDCVSVIEMPQDAVDNVNGESRSSGPATQFGFVRSSTLPDSSLQWLAAYKLNCGVKLDYRVVLRRDLYYRGPRGELSFDMQAVDGYQVLGDHVAASIDSRQEYPDGIPRSAIIGRIPPVDCH
jgi:hypothetical protein